MRHQRKLSFMSDVLFKYVLSREQKESARVREFVVKEVIGESYRDLQVKNPELIPEMIIQKNIILDTLLENKDVIIDIEMQASPLNSYLYARFGYYLSRLCGNQLSPGDHYHLLKPSLMILFVNDCQKQTPSLILEKSILDVTYYCPVEFVWEKIYIVQIPYIDEIVKQKSVLTEFEAFVYFLYHNDMGNIQWENKEGVIEMLEKLRARFANHKNLYNGAKGRYVLTVDYDKMLESYLSDSEKRHQQELREEKIKSSLLLIQVIYNQDASSWIEKCTIEQLEKIAVLCFLKLDYETFQQKVLE